MALPRFTSVVLTWLPPEEPNGIITSYEVTYRVSERQLVNTTVKPPHTTHTIRLLPQTRVSDLSVTAHNRAGRGWTTTVPDVESLEEGKY